MRYSTDQRRYMDQYVTRLVEYRIARLYNKILWEAAPALVQKPGRANYRVNFDLRPINLITNPIE